MKAPILITGESFANFDSESKKFLTSKEEMAKCKAIAFIAKSAGERITSNFFIKFLKPSAPTKSFSTTEKAIEWLLKFT